MSKTFTHGLTLAFVMVLVLIAPMISEAGLDDKSLVLYLSFDEGKGNDAKDHPQARCSRTTL